MVRLISGTKIAEVARAAHDDVDVHMAVVYCPEKIIRVFELDEEEAYCLRTGDLSKVDLDGEDLDRAREMFETPQAGLSDVRSAYRIWGQFAAVRGSELCT
jgi:hypothetical protein